MLLAALASELEVAGVTVLELKLVDGDVRLVYELGDERDPTAFDEELTAIAGRFNGTVDGAPGRIRTDLRAIGVDSERTAAVVWRVEATWLRWFNGGRWDAEKLFARIAEMAEEDVPLADLGVELPEEP